MNLQQYAIAFLTILLAKAGSFALTIGKAHLIITIADAGGATTKIGFNFAAAGAIAIAIISGQSGTIPVRVGNEIYNVTIQAAIPALAGQSAATAVKSVGA